MKSIQYMLFGKPDGIDDYLDLSQRLRPKAVRVILRTRENMMGMYLIKSLQGLFVWNFENGKIAVEKIFGGFFYDESKKHQKRSIDIANQKLRFVIHRIESHHIKIIGKEDQFKYSLIDKWGEK